MMLRFTRLPSLAFPSPSTPSRKPGQTRMLLTGALSLAIPAFACVAGPIDPPAGPVGPTMKTLDQVEPRIAINAENTPGDANSLFRISQPGSYYLTGNITGQAGLHGIEIGASGVTLDLNGFTLAGVPGSLDGIATGFLLFDVTIRNGVVRSWGGDGIDLTEGGDLARYFIIEGITARANGGRGIRAGRFTTIRHCIAAFNGSHGISVVGRSVIEACTTHSNGGSGFELGLASVITGSVANENDIHGINADASAVVTDCVAESNGEDGIRGPLGTTVAGSVARNNGSNGIIVFQGSTVRDCSADGNTFAGIYASGRCQVLNSNVSDNDLCGIRVFAEDTRVQGVNATGNGVGFLIESPGNILLGNTASGNATQWQVVAGNKCLVVLAPNAPAINGVSGGASPGTTNPHANFSY